MRHIKTCGILILALIIPLTSSGEGRFERFDFKLKGEITDVITEDLNGDGFAEVIAIHMDKKSKNPGRYLTIFPHDPAKGFDETRKIEWTFPREVAAVDLGDVQAEPGRELVFITEKGVSCACMKDGRISPLKEILSVQSVVAIPHESDVPYYNFVRDYTGDGKDDVLVCGFYDTLVAVQGEGYSFSSQRINLRPTLDVSAFDSGGMMTTQENPMFLVSYRVPQLFVQDYQGDGMADLVVNFRKKILIYEQDQPGRFTTDPVKTYHVELFKEDNTSHRRRPPSNVSFTDLDGDGRMDILYNQVTGNVSKLRSRSVLYWGNSTNIEKGKPDVEFKTENPVFGRIIVQDVNGDGRPDLIMPTFALNAWSVGKALLTGDVNLEWAYFFQKPDRTYNLTPDNMVTTDLRFSISKLRLESGIPNVMGDFNGDGHPDLILGESENLLVITPRGPDGEPLELVEKIEVPVSMITRSVNLNDDNLSDILIHYREGGEWAGYLRIFLNRGPWVMEE